MKLLTNEELKNINGGGVSGFIAGIFAVGSFIAFLAGVLDGYTRPLRCNQEVLFMELSVQKMQEVVGGITLSGALISAFKGYYTVLRELGQYFGSGIRRITTGTYCQVKQL